MAARQDTLPGIFHRSNQLRYMLVTRVAPL